MGSLNVKINPQMGKKMLLFIPGFSHYHGIHQKGNTLFFIPFYCICGIFLLDNSITFPACQPGILIKYVQKDRAQRVLLQILTVLNQLQNCNSTPFPARCCLCRPKNGGKYCVGRRMKFKSCNTEPCSKLKKDFRDEQCADFDGKHFNINGLPTNVRWVPKYSGSKWLGGCRSCLLDCCLG